MLSSDSSPSTGPIKKPPKPKPIGKVWFLWNSWETNLVLLILTALICLPGCFVAFIVASVILWPHTLPPLPERFEKQPLSHWVEQADSQNLSIKRKGLQMISEILCLRYPNMMNCGGGIVLNADKVYFERIEQALPEHEDTIIRLAACDISSSDTEVRIAAYRMVGAAASRLSTLAQDSPLRKTFLDAAQFVIRDETSEQALKSAAAKALLQLSDETYLESHVEETIKLCAHAVWSETDSEFYQTQHNAWLEPHYLKNRTILDVVSKLPKSARTTFLDQLSEFAAKAPSLPDKNRFAHVRDLYLGELINLPDEKILPPVGDR